MASPTVPRPVAEAFADKIRAVALKIQQKIYKILGSGRVYRKEPKVTTAYGFGTTLPVPYEEAILLEVSRYC
jgi:hypothetical protein